MTRTTGFRRIVGVVAMAFVLGAGAGPVSARTFDFNSHGSFVQQPSSGQPRATAPTQGGDNIDWGYVAIGSSAVALVLVGASGALMTGRRRNRRPTPTP